MRRGSGGLRDGCRATFYTGTYSSDQTTRFPFVGFLKDGSTLGHDRKFGPLFVGRSAFRFTALSSQHGKENRS